MISESQREVTFPAMRVQQPIGPLFVGKMSARDLINISWFDVRQRTGTSDLDEYMGIQRRVSEARVREIARYVELSDATFPTAVILAVEGRCTEVHDIEISGVASPFCNVTLRNIPGGFDSEETILFRGIARVLDGQHRIRGLADSRADLDKFEVNVCVVVDADIADQASIFATVNLAQTKVNRSLVYDLLAYSESRSPERTCHSVTVALDSRQKSPFFRRIKRLGVATEGRFGEILTQATIVQSLLPYVSNDVLRDRDIGRRVGSWRSSEAFNRKTLIFRQWFIEDRDEDIALQLMYYFEAVKRRWPTAWSSDAKGNMLPRTNGFRAFMRFLRPAFLHLSDGEIVKNSMFEELFSKVDLQDSDFATSRFLPGTQGEKDLFLALLAQTGLKELAT